MDAGSGKTGKERFNTAPWPSHEGAETSAVVTEAVEGAVVEVEHGAEEVQEGEEEEATAVVDMAQRGREAQLARREYGNELDDGPASR